MECQSIAQLVSSSVALPAQLVVKLQSEVQASALGLGVDFVFPLSQEQQQQEPHQNIPEGSLLEVLNLTHRLITSPLLHYPTNINSTPPMLTLWDPTFLPSNFFSHHFFVVNRSLKL